MAATAIWKVTHLQAGQPRPYADSIYEYEIELDGDWYGKRPDFGEAVVKQAAQGLTRGWSNNPGWADRKLDRFEKLEPHRWFVRIIEPYPD